MSALIRYCLTYPGLSMATACVALMFGLPFVLPVNTFPAPTFYQEWVAVALGCAAILALLISRAPSGFDVPRIMLLPLAILALLLIQMMLGRLVYWQQGALAAMYLLWSIAMMCVGCTLRRRLGWEKFCSAAAWAILFGTLATALFGISQLVGWDLGGLVAPMLGPRVHANLGQSNHFAAYLSMGLISIMYLAAVGHLNWFVAISAVVLILAMANYSGSRSVWLYLSAACALSFWVHWRLKSKQSKSLAAWSVAGMAILLAVQFASVSILEVSSLRHVTVAGRLLDGNVGSSHRQITWLASLIMFKSAPFSGVGFGAFAGHYFSLLAELPAGSHEQITDNAHNLVLHLLAEFGLPGGIVLIGAGLVWWVSRYRQGATLQVWWLLSLVAIMSLHSLLEYPLWYAYFLGPFTLLLGAGDDSRWSVSPASSSRLMVAGLSLVTVWTLASVFYDYRAVDRLGGVAAMGQGDEHMRDESIRIAGSSLFVNFLELGLSRTIVVNPRNLDAKLQLNGRVFLAYPAADVAYRQSALHALDGDLVSAYRIWDLSVAAFPGEATAQVNALKQGLSRGVTQLAPLVEYAASRTGEH